MILITTSVTHDSQWNSSELICITRLRMILICSAYGTHMVRLLRTYYANGKQQLVTHGTHSVHIQNSSYTHPVRTMVCISVCISCADVTHTVLNWYAIYLQAMFCYAFYAFVTHHGTHVRYGTHKLVTHVTHTVRMLYACGTHTVRNA